MYLIYLDEAGSPKQSDSSNQYVLSAFIVHESKKFKIVDDVCELKRKYFPDNDPNDVEFHMKDLAHHNGIFKQLGLEKEKMLIKEIGELIQRSDCTLITVAIKKTNLWGNMAEKVSELAMKFLFERICLFLNDNNAIYRNNSQFGILMLDSVNKQVDNKTRTQITGMIENGTEYNSSEYFIDQPLFVQSCNDHIMQLADYVAYCMRRRMMKFEDGNKANYEMYRKITDNFQSKYLRNGKDGIGFKIYPD